MKRTKKIILGIVAALVVSYVAGGITAAFVVDGIVFERRGSDESKLKNVEYRLRYQREDYPSLATREVYSVPSNGNKLAGYFYKADPSKGVVITAHGMNSLSDGLDVAYQQWFRSQGYSVFALDLTASGRSEGTSMVGLHQSALDVQCAYNFLQSNGLLHGKTILCGHSWGGFGAAMSVGLGVKADVVITFSAFANTFDTMVSYAAQKVGPLAYATLPTFYLGTAMKHGPSAFYDAAKAVRESSSKFLIIHGEEDKQVPLEGTSLYGKTRDYPNVRAVALPGIGHEAPWESLAAKEYLQKDVLPKLEELKREGASAEEINAFTSSVDKSRSSELNADLFATIQSFLEGIQ
ncbi:MAG: alpha/beta hydrolase [Bacilli bacterium]|nr:alpha/beta hydrolase [Bacilli bacterium]